MPEFQFTKLRQSAILRRLPTLAVIALIGGISCAEAGAPTSASDVDWGSYLKPFSADSFWNSRPVGAVFANFEIPKSSYFPMVGAGPYSTAVFLAGANDPPEVIHSRPDKPGIWDPDAESSQPTVMIPHWPAATAAATGSDGHADIIDVTTGIVHSFFQLKNVNGQWIATQYAWSPLKGTGWGNPAHYFQGARAAGVPTAAGLIRLHEIDDGLPTYHHALAMSLTYNALSAKPAYIYPATAADTGAEKQNYGSIPEGALVMLPPDFDTSKISSPALLKVAETLKTYGAYVVDRNVGTPFVIYVENGGGYNLHHGGWNNKVASNLDYIRSALRQVTEVKGWIDGNGHKFTPQKNQFNLLSMRGPWVLKSGAKPGVFDTWSQSLKFAAPEDGKSVVQQNGNSTGLSHVSWAAIVPGTKLRLTVHASAAAKLQFTVMHGSAKFFDSGRLADGQKAEFVWPEKGYAVLTAVSDPASESTVSAELIALDTD